MIPGLLGTCWQLKLTNLVGYLPSRQLYVHVHVFAAWRTWRMSAGNYSPHWSEKTTSSRHPRETKTRCAHESGRDKCDRMMANDRGRAMARSNGCYATPERGDWFNLTISDDTVSPHNDMCILGKVKIGSHLREVATKERLSVVIAEKSQDNQRQGRKQ